MIKKTGIFILIILISIFTISTFVQAVDLGGELNTTLSGIVDQQDEVQTYFSKSLDLELFLPSFGKTDAKARFVITNKEEPLLDGTKEINTSFFIKKLYLKHKFNDFYLTVGRQPVSWSFGSMLNPVDFNPGAVAMDQETMGKYLDAVELYYPVNWNSGLEVLVASHQLSNNYKYAIRGRAGIKGYDLTLNYIREPQYTEEITIPDIGDIEEETPAADRIGFTAKGDMGPIGTYGAVGYYKSRESDDPVYSYLIGGDYSFTYDYDKKVIMQLEYLNIEENRLEEILGLQIQDSEDNYNLLLGNINYNPNSFSSLGLMAVASLDDSSIMIIPVYKNQLPGNINLSLRGSIYNGNQGDILKNSAITGAFELSLSYPF